MRNKTENKKEALAIMLATLAAMGTVTAPVNYSFADEKNENKTTQTSLAETRETKEVITKDNAQLSDAAKKLIALDIIRGREGGDIAPNSNITRAEVTTIILRALGIESHNYVSKESFVDVPPSAWYAKDVTVAKELGLIVGIGNDRFAPLKNVSNAELVTMLVRALDYEKTVNNTANISYPNFHISKAQEAGILEGVKSDIRSVSKRDDMFLLISNALNSKVLERNSLGVYAPSDKTMMEKHLGLKEYKAQIVDSGSLLSGLGAGKVKIEGIFDSTGKVTSKVVNTEDPTLLSIENLFNEVSVIVDKNDKAIYTSSVIKNEMFTGVVDKVDRVNRENVIKLVDSTKEYVLSDDVVVIHNYEKVTNTNLRSILEGSNVRYSIKDNKVDKIISEKVSEVSIFKSYSNNIIEVMSGPRISLKDMDNVTIYLNGEIAKVEDLKANDLLQKFSNGKNIIIRASRESVSGKLVSVSRNNKIKIGDKDYTLSKSYRVSINKGASLSGGLIENLVGENVSAYLNRSGEVELIIGDVDAKLESIYVVDRVSTGTKDKSDIVHLVDTDGRTSSYTVANKVNVANLQKGDLVAVSIDSKEITSISKITKSSNLKYHSLVELRDITSRDVDYRNLTISTDREDYDVSSENTPVYIFNSKDIEVVSFKDLDDFKGKINVNLIMKDREAVVIYINNQNFKFEEKEVKGMLKDIYSSTFEGKKTTMIEIEMSNGNVEKLPLHQDASVYSFAEAGYGKTSSNLSDIKDGEIVSLFVNNKGYVTEVKEVSLMDNLDLKNNVVKYSDRYEVKIGDKVYDLASNALLVDKTSKRGGEVLSSGYDIPRDSIVVFSIEKNKINNLVIVGFSGDDLGGDLTYEKDFISSVNNLETLVSKYKNTSDVTLSQLETLQIVAEAKLSLVQSQNEVADEKDLFNNLKAEISNLKSLNEVAIEAYKSLKGELSLQIGDFLVDGGNYSEEDIQSKILDTKAALNTVKDKTVMDVEDLNELDALISSFNDYVETITPPENEDVEEEVEEG